MTGNKFLILKTGNTISSLLDKGEDFEDWFIAGSGLPADEFVVCELFRGEPLPDLEETAGIIITGSPAYVTDLEPWNETGASYLRAAQQMQVPILGVCYGHQLLAWAFGGEVGFHPRGREIGSVPVALTAEARADALFNALPAEFIAQVSHQQSVLTLPDGAVLLAHNEFEPHHAFRLGNTSWGIQFHPEFDAAIMAAYIVERSAALASEAISPEALLSKVSDSAEAATLVRQFCLFATASRNQA